MPQSLPTLCGSIMGSPFSLSAKIHNAAYAALGLDYTFVCFGVEDPVAAVAAIRTLGVRGMNVSMPYKTAVMPHLDKIDESAHVIGAVNTINNVDGVLTGYNTDYLGAIRALQEVTALDGKRIAVIGAGGAARAVVFGCVQAAARVTVFNRSAERGVALAKDLGAGWGGSVEAFTASHFDIVINATSASLAGDSLPLPDGIFAPGSLAYDMMYGKGETPFLARARAQGAGRLADGLGMLVEQAAEAFLVWRGVRPETAPVLAELRHQLTA